MGISIACVLMAAGSSSRYGKNKLLEPVEGKSMIERALDAVNCGEFCSRIAVTQYPQVETAASARGFSVIYNPRPEEGASGTVRIGALAAADADGIMFCVADQPYLSGETVKGLCALFRAHPESIIAPVSGGKRGNPCIFPAALLSELTSLSGDRGGSAVIAAHPELLITLEAPARELCDVDTPHSPAPPPSTARI